MNVQPPPLTAALQLEAVEIRLPRQPWPLRPRIRAALAERGEPLRWAITAVEADPRGSLVCIEAVLAIRRPL